MSFDRAYRMRMADTYAQLALKMPKMIQVLRERQGLADEVLSDYSVAHNKPLLTKEDLIADIQSESMEFALCARLLLGAQTIMFDHDQATIFKEVSKDYTDSLDFRVPFTATLLQFTAPVAVTCDGIDDAINAILLFQIELTPDNFTATYREAVTMLKMTPEDLRAMLPEKEIGHLHTIMFPLFTDGNQRKVSWSSSGSDFFERSYDPQNASEWGMIRNLATACIGFINAENVKIQKVAVEEKVNRKRAREGKHLLPDYYVCRIRGVTYDSQGRVIEQDATGRHVSFRFSVRGHFRKLPTGKVTWVRPHERGVGHELFKPKVYSVQPTEG